MNADELVLEPASVAAPASTPAPLVKIDPGLSEVEKNWNEFGKRDPLWAILTDESKRNNQWDLTEFFAHGEREIEGVLQHADSLKHQYKKGKALDFGCGVGRLTQALCRHFEECHGVDIAASMVEQARQYNRHGARCHYHVNTQPDLTLFSSGTFDFIYTNIVLQHNPPAMARKFIQEFIRILKPGGMLVFQIPSEPLQHSAAGASLPSEGFRAQLSVVADGTPWLAGTTKKITVTVKNLSPVIWPGKGVSGKYPIRIGNHWRDAQHRVVINDDARADLPADLAPNQEISVPVNVTVPGRAGNYNLEMDIVQENVAWFGGRGSKTVMVPVNVVADVQISAPAAAAPAVLVPRMDMNGIRKNDVLAFLKEHGAQVLQAANDNSASGWVSYRYYVTKPVVSAALIPKKSAVTTNASAPAIVAPRSVANANFEFSEDLLHSLRGRIAIVGNATPPREFGAIIDAYDVIIRLNNYRVAGFEKLVGSRAHFRCTSAWSDVEHRDALPEFSPFIAVATESAHLAAFNRANRRPVLSACTDIHSLIPETSKPSTGLSLVQLCAYLGIPVDLFGFDGFKTAHYWEGRGDFHTTHSRSEMEFLLRRSGVVLYGETYPYQALYDFCHQNHSDYNENVGLELVRRLNRQFSGLKIIEFGSGNGDLARHLEQSGNRVTAVEASRHACDRIQCTQKINGTALDLPFIRDSFDLFTSVDVLEHLTENDCRIVIREAARLTTRIFVSVCTRPSGLLGPNGENLHLTVRPPSWWAQEFSRYFTNVRTYAGYGNGQLVIEGERLVQNSSPVEINTKSSASASTASSDEFYVNLFVNDPVWSAPTPNEDERARWEKISTFVKAHAAGRLLRILDLGCGRGWLTRQLSAFGNCQGVEPVSPVIEQARKLFPDLKFTVGTADTILTAPDFQPFDLVVSSEVIEHVPCDQQPAFAQKISRLLRPEGLAILTTPRGEALAEWTQIAGDPSQPVEDWLLEPELCQLFTGEKFTVAGRERVFFDGTTRRFVSPAPSDDRSGLLPVYQVWAFRKPSAVPAVPAAVAVTRPSGYSFCIITNGKRPQKLVEEIASIRALNIPTYEILVGGDVPADLEDVRIVSLPQAAANGQLGEMRNRLIEQARFDHLVIADDDLIFQPDFYQGLQQYGENYEVLCVRFLNADGTRYWDWATVGGPRGHQLLDYLETDPDVYVTGGLCVMKAHVADRVKWDGVRGFYKGEDVDFSGRLHQAGISIKFNPLSTVVHTDARYTQVDKVILTAEPLTEIVRARIHQNKLEEAREFLGHLRRVDAAAAATAELDLAALAAPVAPALSLPVRWRGPIFNPSGYASEAINYILPLAEQVELGIHHQNNVYSEKFVAGLPAADRARLFALRDKCAKISGGIVIEHQPANAFTRLSDAAYCVGRTMFETDRIPAAWVTACNQMDEIWVPSKFNVETFAASGVLRDKLVVMPESVDENEFNPNNHQPLPLPHRAAFNFLAIFEWSRRKGWDLLLSAYLREFSAADDVCLYLRTYLFSRPDGDPSVAIQKLIDEHAAKLNLGDKPLPRIHIIAEQVAQADLPRLYKAADCLVAPSRGEGWGRPHHEAMMMGLPVIATNWSGNTEFMNTGNSYLIDYELTDTTSLDPELRHYRNQRWAEPSEKSLRQHMRQVQQHPLLAQAKGLRARREMLRSYSRGPVTKLVVARLLEIQRKLSTPICPVAPTRKSEANDASRKLSRLRVNWEGSFLDLGSLSHVNRELTAALNAADPNLQLTRISAQTLPANLADNADLKNLSRRIELKSSANTEVTIRHAWPPNWQRPASGAFILIQPWEFGALPADWVRHLANVDEVWAPSEYVRRVYLESGLHPDKVKVVPNGIDPQKFRPGLESLKLATQKKFKFLFVGGTIARKGPDVLLNAYLKTFTDADDVCLVIKDFGGQSVYQGQTLEKQIAAAQLQPGAPEILYLTQELSPADMPRLYASCDCLLHPYRGEGFGLPVLEAMACALPVVVTGGGSTDDFAPDEFAARIPALKTSLGASVAGLKLTHNGWWLEPDAAAFAERLRWIAANPAPAKVMGLAASEYVRREWTWERAAQVAAVRLREVATHKQAEVAATVARRARKAEGIKLPEVALLGNLVSARELLANKNFTDAWSAAVTALNVRPFHCDAWLLLAEIAKAAGDSAQARACAERAVALAPNWKPAKHFLKGVFKSGQSIAWPALPASSAAPRLTVCLITRNEEKFLPQCLASIREIAHQIVVVDTGSTDATIAIAKKFGAEVHHFAWSDDFSAARNVALKHATGDWVLSLDADEELLTEHCSTILREIQVSDVMAYRLPIINIGREEEGASFVPRLFRNAPGLFYVGRVHEQIFSSVQVRAREWNLQNRHGQTALLHHGYVKEVVITRDKVARNLRLLELAIEELPNEPNLLMNYGLELVRSGQQQEGLNQTLEALHVMSRLPAEQIVPELRETLFTQISSQLLTGKLHQDLVELWKTPFAKAAGQTASQHFALGLAHLELNQPAEAAAQMRACLAKRHLPTLSPVNPEILKGGPNHCLALAHIATKDNVAAEAAFQAALKDDPTARRVRFDFARFLATIQPVAALQMLHALAAEEPTDASIWEFGAQLALSQPQFLDFAQNWTSEAIKNLPANAALRAFYAEALLLAENAAVALQFFTSNTPRQLAAEILCQAVTGAPFSPVAAQHEKAVSQEFLAWYRKLIKFNAVKVLHPLNSSLATLPLPTAQASLHAALTRATVPAVN